MSTGGPDPAAEQPPNPDAARGDLGNVSAARLGMPSLLTAIVAVLAAVLFIGYVLLR